MLPQSHTDESSLSAIARLFRRTPMLFVLLALVSGILLAEYVWLPSTQWTAVMLAVGVMALAAVLRCRPLFYPLLWLTLVAASWLTVGLHRPRDPFASQPSPPGLMLVEVHDTPRPTARCYKCQARVLAVGDSAGWHATRGSIMLLLQQDSAAASVRYGDRLFVRQQAQRPDSARNPYQFDYQRYLRHKGMLWQCYVPSHCWQLAGAKPQRGIVAFSKRLQHTLVQRIRHSQLSPHQQGIVAALALGWRADVDDVAQRQFRDAGIAHLLCVSGLHVGIVASLLGCCLFFLDRRPVPRAIKGGVQIAGVWLFVLLSGMAPSSLRAGVMFSLLILGDMLQRRSNGFNNLCTSALLLLVVNPMLLFDVGFQLSYAAVAGIMAWQKPLRQLLPIPRRCVLLAHLWDWTCLSVAAQLATLPLVLYYFHQFPLYFLVANLVVIPLSALLLASMFVMLLPGVGRWAATWVGLQLDGVDRVVGWVSSLPHAVLDGLYCDLPVALMLTLALLCLSLLLCHRRRWTLPSLLACLLLLTCYLTAVDRQAARQHEMVLFDAGRHLAIECVAGRQSYLVCDSLVARDPTLIAYQREGWQLRHRIVATMVLPVDTTFSDGRCLVSHRCIVFGGRRIQILDSAIAEPFRRFAHVRAVPSVTHYDAVVVAPRTRLDTVRVRDALLCDTLLYRYGFTRLDSFRR